MTICSQRVSVCKTYLNEFRSLLWEMFKLQFKAKCQTAGWEVGTETRHSHRSDWWKEGVKTDMRQLTAKGWPMTMQQQALTSDGTSFCEHPQCRQCCLIKHLRRKDSFLLSFRYSDCCVKWQCGQRHQKVQGCRHLFWWRLHRTETSQNYCHIQ